MGKFTYNGIVTADFEDRLLLHLQLVIAAKLRRGESFMFSWTKPADQGGGRTTVWIDAHVPLAFEYVATAMPTVSRHWVEELTQTTYRPSGLQIVPEPDTVPAEPQPAPA
jgi:hypothetical protein